MEKRQNIGYTITKSIVVEGIEFVLGEKERPFPAFATWQYKDGAYFDGYFTYERLKAERNLYQRAMDTLDLAEWAQFHLQKRNIESNGLER